MNRTLYSLRPGNRRHGFVLVVTVMILAISALIVAGISRHSLFLATTAKIERSRLQEKWAVTSCQRFCLASGNRLLTSIRNRQLRLTVELSGLLIVNDICDESARLDINSLADNVSRFELEQLIRDTGVTSPFVIELNPRAVSSGDTLRRPYESWGQVFLAREPDSLNGIRTASQVLTLWGNRLNFRVADPEVIQMAIKPVAGSIMASRFLSEYGENPESSLAELLSAIGANDRQRQKLVRLLSDRSWATSVWTTVVNEGRTSGYFAVQQRPIDNLSRYQTFQWQ